MISEICSYLLLFAIIVLSLQQEIRSLKQYKLH